MTVKTPLIKNGAEIPEEFRGEASPVVEESQTLLADIGRKVLACSLADIAIENSNKLFNLALVELNRINEPIYPNEGNLFVLVSKNDEPLKVYNSRFVDSDCNSGYVYDPYTRITRVDDPEKQIIFVADRMKIRVPSGTSPLRGAGAYYYEFDFKNAPYQGFLPSAEFDYSDDDKRTFSVFEASTSTIFGWVRDEKVFLAGFGRRELANFRELFRH